jgi:hypothetical protein
MIAKIAIAVNLCWPSDRAFQFFPNEGQLRAVALTYVAERDRLPTNPEGLAPYYLLKVLHLGRA